MVDDWCEHHKTSGSQLIYASEPFEWFGKWSEYGKSDNKLGDLMEKSGVELWESFETRICLVKELGVAAAFIFNAKGVDETGPWWHQDIIEKHYNKHFCDSNQLNADCHDMKSFWAPATEAIGTYLQLKPGAVIISSNAWDVNRLRYHHHVPWQTFKTSEIQNTWKQGATNLIKTVKTILPDSKIVWHTTALGRVNKKDFVLIEVNYDDIAKAIYNSPTEVNLPGSHMGIQAFNRAAREVCKEQGIPLEELELDDMEYRDDFHPASKKNVEFVQHLVQTYL